MKKEKKEPKANPSSSTKAVSLKERMQKHITDKNDVITDEDIKNVKVGEETDEEKAAAEKDAKDIDKTKIISPWTVLSEEDK